MTLVVTDQIDNGREAEGLHEAVQAASVVDLYQLITASLPGTHTNQFYNTLIS